MPRADEEPERSDAAPGTGRRRPSGRLLLPLVVAGACAVVLSTAVGGRPRFTSPFGGAPADPTRPAPDPVRTVPVAQPSADPLVPAVGGAVQTILLVLACLVALAVAVLLIRFIVAAIRARRRRTGVAGHRTIDAEAGPEVADAPTVLRGIAAALVALDEQREPGDAVVQAWLGLQQAAEDAGLARSAAETPTEFTGRVLTRTGADRTALRTLLRLYLGARFGDGTVTTADAAAARDALRALEASWGRVTA